MLRQSALRQQRFGHYSRLASVAHTSQQQFGHASSEIKFYQNSEVASREQNRQAMIQTFRLQYVTNF